MDNTNETNQLDLMAFKFLDFARKSVLITNMALSESMNEGLFATYEAFKDNGGYLVMGVRPNSSAIAAAYSGNRILWSEVVVEKGEELKMHHRLNAVNCPSADDNDRAWVELVDQIEEWTKCEREEIQVSPIGNDNA